MRPRWFTFISIFSLPLAVLVFILWLHDRDWPHENLIEVRYIRSYAFDERYAFYLTGKSYLGTLSLDLGFQHFSPSYARRLSRDEVNGFRFLYPPGFRALVQGPTGAVFTAPPRPGFDAWRAQAHNAPLGHSSQFCGVAFRPWLAMMLLTIAPAMWLNRYRKSRRARRLGQCANCGYDLRASTGRCPECGKVFTKTDTGGPAARAIASQDQSENPTPIPPARTAIAGG